MHACTIRDSRVCTDTGDGCKLMRPPAEHNGGECLANTEASALCVLARICVVFRGRIASASQCALLVIVTPTDSVSASVSVCFRV